MTAKSIDYDLLNQMVALLEDDFPIIVDTFIDSTYKIIALLQDLLKNQDSEEYALKIHGLKGSCGNMGAVYLAELCKRDESLSKTGKVDKIDPLLTDIKTEFEVVKTSLLAFKNSFNFEG